MNKVILTGRLTADPDLRETPSGVKVTRFTVAVDRRYTKNADKTADFIPCVAWRGTAEFVAQYFAKGKAIALDGQMQTRTYTAQDGTNRYVTEVIVDNVEFNGPKEQSTQQTSQQPAQQSGGYPYTGKGSYQVPDDYGFEELPDEEDLPF